MNTGADIEPCRLRLRSFTYLAHLIKQTDASTLGASIPHRQRMFLSLLPAIPCWMDFAQAHQTLAQLLA